ncbi:transmembrane protein 179B [Mugil cephalus]|uniref:transmembrane protein 179B n=1 Tax=Mugil cephalus TaxID=48193 RepID=UPI001FB6EE4D|nr:transmembrane protein 179B [Mugil cephalus]
MMAPPVLLLLELVLYVSCFVCGIVTAASITIVQGDFGGRCMLYGIVNYNATAKLIGVQSSSSPSLCYFASAISILVAVMCFSLSLYWGYTLCFDTDQRRERMSMNVVVVLCGVFLFFLLITGCMLKIGRDSLCSSITKTVTNITSCEQAQTLKWAIPRSGGPFFSGLQKAETAVWVNFFFWIIIGVLVFVQRRQSSKVIAGGGPGAGLFGGDSGVTPEETEPFFNNPARPQ